MNIRIDVHAVLTTLPTLALSSFERMAIAERKRSVALSFDAKICRRIFQRLCFVLQTWLATKDLLMERVKSRAFLALHEKCLVLVLIQYGFEIYSNWIVQSLQCCGPSPKMEIVVMAVTM